MGGLSDFARTSSVAIEPGLQNVNRLQELRLQQQAASPQQGGNQIGMPPQVWGQQPQQQNSSVWDANGYKNDITEHSQKLLKQAGAGEDGTVTPMQFALSFGKNLEDIKNKLKIATNIDFAYNEDGTTKETGGDGKIDKRDLSNYLALMDQQSDGRFDGKASLQTVQNSEKLDFGNNKVLNGFRNYLRLINNFFILDDAQKTVSADKTSVEGEKQLTMEEKASQIVDSYLKGDTSLPGLAAAKLCGREKEIPTT